MPMIARVYNRNFVHVNQVHVHFTTEGIHEPLDIAINNTKSTKLRTLIE